MTMLSPAQRSSTLKNSSCCLLFGGGGNARIISCGAQHLEQDTGITDADAGVGR